MSLPVTIAATADLIAVESSVGGALYAQLQAAYTPQYGPSANSQIPSGGWVYLWAGSENGGQFYDYAALSSLGEPAVPQFATLTSTAPLQFPLPSCAASGRIVFGVPQAPSIPIVSGEPLPATPIDTPTVYDFRRVLLWRSIVRRSLRGYHGHRSIRHPVADSNGAAPGRGQPAAERVGSVP